LKSVSKKAYRNTKVSVITDIKQTLRQTKGYKINYSLV